jgi:tubulin polyglutamylase TTLL1
MIDDDLKPYLIEMNTNPCLELSCSFLARIIPTMIESAVRICVDPYFPPPIYPKSKKHTLPDPNDCLFEQIFNEKRDGAEFKTLPGSEAMIDMIAEDLEEDQVSDSEDEREVE